jgi:hypothetical protein
MADKIAPSPGQQPDKTKDAPANVGGSPPPQPQKPQPPDPSEKHPVADSKANVDHGPFVPGHTDRQADVKGGVSPEIAAKRPPGFPLPAESIEDKKPGAAAHPREDDKGPAASPAGIPRTALKQEGNTIRFDWYPASVSQIVTLHRGKKAFVESIVGEVISCGTDPGPTCLTFRKVPAGFALTTGKALHTGSIDLIGPINVDIAGIKQEMAMVPEEADRTIEEGDCIAADFSGAMKGARGTVTIKLSHK